MIVSCMFNLLIEESRANSLLGTGLGVFTLLLMMSQLIHSIAFSFYLAELLNTVTDHNIIFFLLSSAVNMGFLVISC